MNNAKSREYTAKDYQKMRASAAERADLSEEERENLIQTYYNMEAIATIGQGSLPDRRDGNALMAIYRYEANRNRDDFEGFCRWCMFCSFLWGKVIGIRQERERRRGASKKED